MNQAPALSKVMQPIWLLATGAFIATAAAFHATITGSTTLRWALIAAGALAILRGVQPERRRHWWLWLAAGLALGAGRGLESTGARLDLEQHMTARNGLTLRATLTITEGWRQARWGWRTRARVRHANQREDQIPLPSSCGLEVRGSCTPEILPTPGATVEALITVRGRGLRPLLVASSAGILRPVAPPRGLPHLRERLYRRLLNAAGTNVTAIRAAELAALLSLGRRDAMPDAVQTQWRRSGLAHLLAVSGLHVGVVAAAMWYLCTFALGCGPRLTRVLILAALPAYALLAGASPSALRAALMGVVYIAARLIGRSVTAMAAVLLAAMTLLLVSPHLIADPGFQLTVLVTASLVRWVGPLVEALPGPRWLVGALAVPLVAQLGAAPVIAWHFRTLAAGALLTNMVVVPLLAPTLIAALTATLLALVPGPLASWTLGALHGLAFLLRLCGAPARASTTVIPALPLLMLVALGISGWLALSYLRVAGRAAVTWVAMLALASALWLGWPWQRTPEVTLLPIRDGAAIALRTDKGTMLLDAGRFDDEAARLLADTGVRELDAVVASHSDADHIGGMPAVLESTTCRQLIIPEWMARDPDAVPLLRVARRQGVLLTEVCRGRALSVAGATLQVLWPVSHASSDSDNERSLVAMIKTPQGWVLATSDIDSAIEARLVAHDALRCDVLIAPHHGARNTMSEPFVRAASPAVILIPAGVENFHHHPDSTLLARLAAHRIPVRYPARDGWCGARPNPWRGYP